MNVLGDDDALGNLKSIFKGGLDGEILYANQTVICGWISDGGYSTNIHKVVLQHNGVALLESDATLNPQEMAYGNELPRTGGFRFSLDDLPDALDTSIGRFDVVTPDGFIVGAFTFSETGTGKVVGAVDKFTLSSRSIRGWIWSPEHPDKSLTVDVYWDEKFLFNHVCDEFQVFRIKRAKDARMANHGFTIKLPHSLIDGDSHKLVIRVSNSTRVIKSCEKVVNTETGAMQPLDHASEVIA